MPLSIPTRLIQKDTSVYLNTYIDGIIKADVPTLWTISSRIHTIGFSIESARLESVMNSGVFMACDLHMYDEGSSVIALFR